MNTAKSHQHQRAQQWANALRLASQLGISPPQFWALSVREWLALTQLPSNLQPPNGADLANMMQAHPD